MSDLPHPEVAILSVALELPAGQRTAYLDQACAGDELLKRELEGLMRAHEQAGTFLEATPCALDIKEAAQVTIPLAEKPGDKVGRYKLLQQIGEGGCGVVYMAEQEEPVKRRVAFKVIKLGMDTKSVIARFEAERQALALMEHPNIAKVLEAGSTDTGRPFFVMELVRGLKITDYCDQNNCSTRERLELFVQICRAIQHAHQKGIIHRDIKPSNILVTVNDGVAVPKVIDFGIAKATQGRLTDQTLFTAFEQFIGTPAYMSPEQAVMTSLDIDTRSDIYSLGVLLYELLTSQTPFTANELLAAGLDAMRRTILQSEPVRPSTRLSTLADADLCTVARHQRVEAPKLIHLIRGDLDWVVMKCLEKERSRSYETANGLAMDVMRHLNNEPVTACPPGNLYRFHKLVRRNKLIFSVISAVVAALLVGLIGILWQWHRAEQHANAESKLRLLTEQQAVEARLNLYAADVNLASQAIQRSDYGLARRTLAALRPKAGEPDLRGFDWRYLWNLCQGDQLATLAGHDWIVMCSTFSPDGRLLATGSQDGTAKVWNIDRRELVTTISTAARAVWSMAFSPDGKLLMAALADGKVKFWNTDTWQSSADFPGQIASLSKSGTLVAVSDANPFFWEPAGQISVWDYSTRRKLKQFDQLGRAPALSPDGRKLAVAGESSGILLWDVKSGELLRTMRTDNPIWSIRFSPDGNRLVTVGWSSDALVWNLEVDRPPDKLTGHTLTVWSATFSPDGSTIATAGSDQSIRMWDAVTLRQKGVFHGHDNEVWCVTFSPDGKLLATGGKDQNVMLWSTEPRMMRASLPNEKEARSIFSPDGTRILTVVNTGLWSHSTLWNVDRQTSVAKFPEDQRAIGFSADGRQVISWDTNAVGLQYWSPENRAAHHVLLEGLELETGPFYQCGFSPEWEKFFAIDRSGLVRFWEADTGKSLGSLRGPAPPIRAAVLSSNGKYLAISLERENPVRLYERATGREMQLAGHHDFVSGLAFAPDCATLASGSMDRTIRLWNTSTGKLMTALPGHMQEVTDLAFSPDGRTLASMARKESVKLWHIATGRELLSVDFPEAYRFLQFSPDGKYLAVTTTENSVRLLDAPTLEKLDNPGPARNAAPFHPK